MNEYKASSYLNTHRHFSNNIINKYNHNTLTINDTITLVSANITFVNVVENTVIIDYLIFNVILISGK